MKKEKKGIEINIIVSLSYYTISWIIWIHFIVRHHSSLTPPLHKQNAKKKNRTLHHIYLVFQTPAGIQMKNKGKLLFNETIQ
jgi:hypothetical protein